MNHLFRHAHVPVLLALLVASLPGGAAAQLAVDLESGVIFSGYNDVRIPGVTGTLISLSEELTTDAAPFIRGRILYSFDDRHHLALLIAPLSLKAEGKFERDINFQGVMFPSNIATSATYRFNSYRLTYRYDFLHGRDFEAGAGLTAKIRDAEIALSGGGRGASKANVGFVPLINFRLHWRFDDPWGLLLEGDALAAPQGRAEDIQLALDYRLSENLGVRLGYRLLEGGADNDEVYNFTLLHYVVLGASLRF